MFCGLTIDLLTVNPVFDEDVLDDRVEVIITLVLAGNNWLDDWNNSDTWDWITDLVCDISGVAYGLTVNLACTEEVLDEPIRFDDLDDSINWDWTIDLLTFN